MLHFVFIAVDIMTVSKESIKHIVNINVFVFVGIFFIETEFVFFSKYHAHIKLVLIIMTSVFVLVHY